ncbi:hypothetical protein RYX56_05580 [Alkalihalophilus lindianensis]|uniref:Uncharacterized protein n=1 Tax=Alkalihalophilus lindianensis TaxID=1630542 RepID=A0ABU3X7G9_9BACI|nr:hypothetical protein [Alkalihalophilus lindianensis]MDV2683779.1 hypothetical protein [Alkalihalophilus lindianensis]MDV2683845.1 hypothetical protein [Alkalihalophilus lindianensis]
MIAAGIVLSMWACYLFGANRTLNIIEKKQEMNKSQIEQVLYSK